MFSAPIIQISMNTFEVTMQVKRAVGKSTLHKLPIYNEYMCHIILHDLLFVF